MSTFLVLLLAAISSYHFSHQSAGIINLTVNCGQVMYLSPVKSSVID